MYAFILALHSLTRWFVLASLLFAIYRAYSGWLTNKSYSKFDNRVRVITTNIAHIQLTIGLWLYFISPIATYFISHFKEAVHERQIRFFGMEHVTMMLIGITLITVARAGLWREVENLAVCTPMFLLHHETSGLHRQSSYVVQCRRTSSYADSRGPCRAMA